MALASLSESMIKSGPQSTELLPESFAVHQHTKAIVDLRKAIRENDDSSPEIVFVTCALFICFEIFQGRHESALSHMSSGIFFLINWTSKYFSNDPIMKNKANNNSSTIFVQLQKIFRRLMLQTILFVQTKPQEWKFITPAFTPDLPHITLAFKSIDEARDCLDSCMCFLYHRVLTSRFQGLENNEIEDLTNDASSETPSNPLNEWSSSFRDFMEKEKQKFSAGELNAARLLEIQNITASILSCAGPSSQESAFDAFEHHFRLIITLASEVIAEVRQDNDPPTFPSIDMGILPHLYFAASRCRHPSTRRQALHLLRDGPMQEGIWHRDVLASIAEQIILMKEMNCQGASSSSDIPASARLSVINATIDLTQRTVILYCCRQQLDKDGRSSVIHEAVIHELIYY